MGLFDGAAASIRAELAPLLTELAALRVEVVALRAALAENTAAQKQPPKRPPART